MRNFIWIAITALLFTACGDDTPETVDFKDGVFVVNQGAFQTGTGTLTFRGNGADTVVQEVFSTVNNGLFLGNIAQSMVEFNDLKYIAVNNAAKIMIAKDEEMTFVDSISGIAQPRYFASNGNDLFVTSWGSNGSDGALTKINTDKSTETIHSEGALEGMAISGDRLYVAKNGGFGRDSMVLIFDISDNSLIKEINVGDKPEQIVVTNNGDVVVICNGYSDWYNPELNTPGRLVRISGDDVVQSVDIPNGANRLAINSESDVLYYVAEGKVVSRNVSLANDEVSDIAVISAYGLAFDQSEKLLYIADAKDFNSAGEVVVYDEAGIEVTRFEAGIIPAYFHFD